MHPQVSRCYYHPDKSAVATCTKCGVGICRDCAVKDDQGRILCYRCGNEYLKLEHKEHRKKIKESGGRFRKGTDFIVPGIIGILFVIAFGVALYYNPSQQLSSTGEYAYLNFVIYSMIAYLLFSIPFGYIVLSDLFAPKYDTVNDSLFKWLLKLTISLFAGWIFFTFFLVRFIIRKITSKAG